MGVVVLYESQTEGSRLTQQRRFGEAELGRRVLAVREKWKPMKEHVIFQAFYIYNYDCSELTMYNSWICSLSSRSENHVHHKLI